MVFCIVVLVDEGSFVLIVGVMLGKGFGEEGFEGVSDDLVVCIVGDCKIECFVGDEFVE